MLQTVFYAVWIVGGLSWIALMVLGIVAVLGFIDLVAGINEWLATFDASALEEWLRRGVVPPGTSPY